MKCTRVKLPEGGVAIVCGRGERPRRCFACHLASGFQCDWKVSKTKTCDRHICVEHAQEVAPQKHLCPEHQEAYKAWLERRQPDPADSDDERQLDADMNAALDLDGSQG